ncbi:MAG: hypothetical protein ACR2PB_05175 [Desulfocapsaceae bacterium]
MDITPPESGGCSGFCRSCGIMHSLPPGAAVDEARLLRERLEKRGTIDLTMSDGNSDPELSTELLFGSQRGKMFGVLECLTDEDQRIFLYGFSGQYNGRWTVPGWAPPLFDVDLFKRLNDPVEREIKELGRQIEQQKDQHRTKELRFSRRQLSKQLMLRIHEIYRLKNFNGLTATLSEAAGCAANMPTGIGDCCAPKMLNQAAELFLTPLSLAEFYFGRSNPSHTREHGLFYPPCNDKCRPLLGFLLCGPSTKPQ